MAQMEIRSYRRVFDLERRIYRIDGLRLNPSGVPLRGIAYFLALALLALLAGKLPLIGDLARLAPWYLRVLAAPGVLAGLLTIVRIDGRSLHVTLGALARYALRPRIVEGLSRRARRRSERTAIFRLEL